MKILIRNQLNIKSIVLLIAMLIPLSNAAAQLNRENGGQKTTWQNLKYAIFFTSYDIEKLLADTNQFNKTMNYFSPVKPSRVYLSSSSRGIADLSLLKKVAERFKAMGIEADGAMVPTSRNRGGPSTYNNTEDLASLKERMQTLAKVFDRIILDDWLFTISTDPKSFEDRGNMSWSEYRTKLILEQSKKYIIDPAKEVNPDVKIIIKFPNWYEGFGQNGYDVYNETNQFDKVAIGIETRVPETQDQHIPIYSGYIFQKWFSSVNPSKWIGSWLDNYEMKGADNYYVAQVWQAVLAQTPEIILWCGGQLYPSTGPSSDVYPHFLKLLPEFDKVAGLLKGSARGVPIYLPFGSTGEYNIFGYLGMAGIPLTPVTEFPAKSENAIFTLFSLKDPNLADKMFERLHNGHDVFMTWDLWKKLKDSEFKNTLSLVPGGQEGSVASSEFRLRKGFKEWSIKSNRDFTFPRIQTTTWPYVRDVAVVQKDYDYGVLLRIPYLKGTIYVLNMPYNSYDLLCLPDEVLNTIRRAFAKEIGVELDGPGKVGMYLFGNKQFVLYNMNDKPSLVSLKFTKKLQENGWTELANGKPLKVSYDESLLRYGGSLLTNVTLTIQPYEIVVVKEP